MVAEPVQATLGFFRQTYGTVAEFVHTQTEKLPDATTVWESAPLSYFGGSSATAHASPPMTLIEKTERQLNAHRSELIFALGTGFGLAGLVYYHRQRLVAGVSPKPRRRRAPRLTNGARTHVVLVVGSPTEPMTRLLALDFEKRGFIVYLTLVDEKDQRYIASNPVTDDVRYLDLSGGTDYAAEISNFGRLFDMEVVPVKGATPHTLTLAAVVFAPTLYFPLGPVENTSVSAWDKVMTRFSVCTRLLSSGLLALVRVQHGKIVCVVPTIASCLRLSYHAPEAVLQNSLKDLFSALAKELRPQGVDVTQIRLGNLNLAHSRTLPASKSTRIPRVVEAEVRSWDPQIQALYGEHFSHAQTKASPVGVGLVSHGLRGLHHLLFDLVLASVHNPSVIYYGSGARTYERIACFLPTALVDLFS